MQVNTVEDKLEALSAGCMLCYNTIKNIVADGKEIIQAEGKTKEAQGYIKELELKLQELRQSVPKEG